MTWREAMSNGCLRWLLETAKVFPLLPRYDDDGCSGRGNEFWGAGDVTAENLGESENSADSWN